MKLSQKLNGKRGDKMTVSLVKIVLTSIKKYCADRGDVGSCCEGCPFNIKCSWCEYCMFGGPHIGEGILPEDWDLDEVDFKDDIEEIN